ncbi:MAG: tRNA dihydrouridine synthase DusB [Candidatus Omnitrophica bacterium]|nr:tRNA dihydrouridine synthase DusB [Candidatus Omnitrophota bacterium]MBU4488195.1 tRNA dihydrouridine synthase DusB [Candidatus Omnitrophota bacterium]MCG2705402.1 tRNA dihydrouridine synthase DusB [Candidatus Omnitrophota bacterium]
MIKIGSARINTNIFLAPLSGCSDLAFRLIAREEGAKFCFFEMVDANALIRNYEKTLRMLKTTKKDSPIAGQLLGADPDLMVDAAQKLVSIRDVSFLDINSACPVRKVVSKGAGARLLEKPETLFKILKKLSSSLNIPVTVKIRTGYNRTDIKNIAEIAMGCEQHGAGAIFVHGRTRAQGYSGEINYEAIKKIKEAVEIPVFGSGNIFTPELAKKMFDETSCDGITVARGSFGNPWIFKNIENYLKSGSVLPEPDFLIRKKVLKKHLAYTDKYRHSIPSAEIGFMRKVAIWYMKGFPYAANTRNEITRTKTYPDLIKLIDEL